MPKIDLQLETPLSTSVRARQVCSMFDVPPSPTGKQHWKGDLPIDERQWNVGLIVGPSGCGKSSVMRQLWGDMPDLTWEGASMLDDFPKGAKLKEITQACSAVGFNTIPAWLRPFHVLSNGEQFRADLARRLVELPADHPVILDEFTSVVDRQVAQIGSHAVQKWARRAERQFVAVTCHYDVIDWLQPDWVLEPATMTFRWRSVRQRPKLKAYIQEVPRSTWEIFAPYHYMTAALPGGAKCYGLFIEGGPDHPVAFTGIRHFPHPKVRDICSISRTVTLPDWQGLGLSFYLNGTLGAAYTARGRRLRNYPAHPAFIRSHGRSKDWALIRKAQDNMMRPRQHRKKTDNTASKGGSRPCAVFEYRGPTMPVAEAKALITLPGEGTSAKQKARNATRWKNTAAKTGKSR